MRGGGRRGAGRGPGRVSAGAAARECPRREPGAAAPPPGPRLPGRASSSREPGVYAGGGGVGIESGFAEPSPGGGSEAAVSGTPATGV